MSDPPITETPPPIVAAPVPCPTIDVAFGLIEQAVRLIAVVDPERLARQLRASIDASFILDPTLARRYLAQRDDMDRKLRILDDAAQLVRNWTIVRENADG